MHHSKMIAAAVACLTLSSVRVRAEPEIPSLEARARTARTAQQHAELSREYRQRAESLEAKAREHVSEIERLARRSPDPMAAKWRHAIKDPMVKAREQLAETHRAAFEARTLATRHAQLAIELGVADASGK
jgi:hypothetical protein